MPVSETVRRPGCESCRARHIKCDKGDPCEQCVRKGRSCVRGTKIKFRHITIPSDGNGNKNEAQYEFPETQKWCRVHGKRLRFIDETAEVKSIHNEDFDSDEDIISDEEAPPSPPRRLQPRRESTGRAGPSLRNNNTTIPTPHTFDAGERSLLPIERGQPYPLTRLPALHPHPEYHSPDAAGHHLPPEDPPRAFSPVSRSQISGPIGSISSIGSNSWSEDPVISEPRRSFCTPNFPLKDRREAGLVRYFIEVIAPPFDYGDPHKRFTTLLPQYAALSPLLLNAILAVAAKSKDEGDSLAFFDKPAEHYHAAALELMKPALSGDEASKTDETNAIAAVILRTYHTISALESGSECQQSSDSIWKFLSSGGASPSRGRLSDAAFWGWLRLEIFRAVMQQEALGLHLDDVEFDRSLQPASDNIWTSRMMLHIVDVIRYCFGETRGSNTYEKLAAYAAQWIRATPESFLPVFVQNPPSEGVFPEIYLSNDSVVVGMQFYHLVRILLTAHNPNMPRLGKNQRLASRTVDNEITSDIKIMCGIAEAIGRNSPAHIIACMGIALAGDRFTVPSEQRAVYEVFASTAETYAWDTALILQHLREAWAWPSEMDHESR